ncbi:MAG: penicillin-binding protein activator [Kofleriaceae bacterium]
MSRPSVSRAAARALAFVALCLALAGCPRPTRRTLVPSVPTSGDAAARQQFLAAQAAFERDGGHIEDFQAIADAYPDDPVAPFALLYAGIASQRSGEAAAAVASLTKLLARTDLEPGLRARGELYLGLAASYLGDADTALPLLARSEAAVEDDQERGEYLAAQVHSHLASARPLDALPWMDRFWKSASAAERAYMLARGATAVAAASPEEIAAAWAAVGERPVAIALLAERAAGERAAAGDRDGAAIIRRQGATARTSLDLPVEQPDETPAGPIAIGRIGAIVGQSARQARLAEQIVKGLHVAAGSLGDGAPGIEIVDAEGPAAAAAVTSMAGGDAIAIVGPADGASVDAASARASELGMPLVTLSPRPEERTGGGRWVFHVMHSAEARARALARRAHAAGLRSFAVLRPESGYGAAVAKAFVAEVAALGDAVVTEVTYPAGTKSFAAIAKKVKGSWQGLFVPDTAEKVELLAPALAAAGLVAAPAGTKKVKGGRPIVLMSTVEGAGDDYLREAGRYSDGALLAPGYFPGADDDLGRRFEQAYLAETGKTPTAVDAYAYDAIRVIAAVVTAGARGRDDLVRRLATAQVDGVTGALRFDADHRRGDDGVVYTVAVDGAAVTVKPLR